MQFGEYQPEMSPFLGYDGGEFFDEAFAAGVAGDKRDTACGRFLFAPGVVREDVFQGNGGEVYPTWVGRQLQAEDVPFHHTNLRISGISVRLPEIGNIG